MTMVLGETDPGWLDCFPEPDVEIVVAYVSASWSELVGLYPRSHHAGEREPDLTKSLADYLDDPVRRRTAALGGRFHAERAINQRRSGKIKQSGRTDVEYHYPAPGSASLTLEFKKLKGTTNCRNSYRNSGISRFLVGPYASAEPRGVMCGLVSVDLQTEVRELGGSLTRCRKRLACIASADGVVVTPPVPVPPHGIVFETHHQKVDGVSTIRLSHLFLPIPAAPSA